MPARFDAFVGRIANASQNRSGAVGDQNRSARDKNDAEPVRRG